MTSAITPYSASLSALTTMKARGYRVPDDAADTLLDTRVNLLVLVTTGGAAEGDAPAADESKEG